MSGMQGYYSLIQYSEYPERIEFVNIGVVVFADASPRVLVKFSNNSRRAEKVFGVYLGKAFDLLKDSMESRIQAEFSSSWEKRNIEKFVSMRAGKVRLSSPKSVLVKDAHALLNDLFDRLVSSIEKPKRGEKAQTKLKNQFKISGVENLLERPKPIELPQGVTIKAPYAYQNGSYNLINAVSLRDGPDLAIANASKHAVEGQWLFNSTQNNQQKRLIVVGDIDGQQHNFIEAVSGMMKEHNVGFYSMKSMDPLVDDIRKNVVNQ